MTILEQLFSSSDRIRVLRYYLFHAEDSFTIADLRSRLGRSLRERTLRELVRFGCLIAAVRPDTGAACYRIDPNWLLFPEFRALFMKAQLLVEHDLVRHLQSSGRLQLIMLSGLFVGDRSSATDALIVGSVNRPKVTRLFKRFERDLNEEVRFTVMTASEYRYRKDVGDRFIYDILERRHLVVADTLQRPRRQPVAAAARRRPTSSGRRLLRRSPSRRRSR